MIPWTFGETATILRAGTPTIDAYGNSVPGPDTEIDVSGCAFGPGSTTEQLNNQDMVTENPNLYMPAGGPAVLPVDRIRFRGIEYQVDGEPAIYNSPLSGTAGPVVVQLRKVT